MHHVLGIDGGGTGCRAALADASGVILGRGAGGPANIRTDLLGARDSLVAAASEAFRAAGVDVEALSATPALLGLAGANVGPYAQEIVGLLPFAESVVETDALISLEGALGEADGAIAILGTGTACLRRRGDALLALGGWGFLLGDQGGGARMGRDLLERALLAHDGLVEATPLLDAVLARFDRDPQTIVEFGREAKPADFGAFAPLIFEHDARRDAAAAGIVASAVSAIDASLDALDLAGGEPLALLGGLAPLLGPRLASRHRARLREPLGDGVSGAVRLALRRFAGRGA